MPKGLPAGCGWLLAGGLALVLVGRCVVGSDDKAPAPGGVTTLSSETPRTRYVQPAGLNCRDGPATSTPTLERLPQGLSVEVAREDDGWSLLDRWQSEDCWVSSRYLGPKRPAVAQRPAALSGGGDGNPYRSDKASRRRAYFANCSAARAAGAAPVYRGDPGYSRKLDRDGDGVGCE